MKNFGAITFRWCAHRSLFDVKIPIPRRAPSSFTAIWHIAAPIGFNRTHNGTNCIDLDQYGSKLNFWSRVCEMNINCHRFWYQIPLPISTFCAMQKIQYVDSDRWRLIGTRHYFWSHRTRLKEGMWHWNRMYWLWRAMAMYIYRQGTLGWFIEIAHITGSLPYTSKLP